MSKTIKVIIIIVFSAGLLCIFSFIRERVHAQVFGIPFGGMVISTIFCPASANTWIVVGPPVGGSYTFDLGTILYRELQPFPGHWVLGLANAFEPCVIFVPSPLGPIPVPIGGGLRIFMMGTSF